MSTRNLLWIIVVLLTISVLHISLWFVFVAGLSAFVLFVLLPGLLGLGADLLREIQVEIEEDRAERIRRQKLAASGFHYVAPPHVAALPVRFQRMVQRGEEDEAICRWGKMPRPRTPRPLVTKVT
jgi:uncharacterized membrane protein YqiK